jgi:hypothetical protein
VVAIKMWMQLKQVLAAAVALLIVQAVYLNLLLPFLLLLLR